MQKEITIFVMLVAAWLLLAVNIGHAQQATRLQVMATADRAKADQAAQRLEFFGVGPADILKADSTYKVRTKLYSSYAEAAMEKNQLRQIGFVDCFAVTDSTTSLSSSHMPVDLLSIKEPTAKILAAAQSDEFRIDFESTAPVIQRPVLSLELREVDNRQIAEPILFQKASTFHGHADVQPAIESLDAYISRFPSGPNIVKAELLLAYWYNTANERVRARKQFMQVIAKYPAADESGEAHLRLGYLDLADSDSEGTGGVKAFYRFRALALGETSCTLAVKAEALLRLAALYHRYKDLDSAQNAYIAIENSVVRDEVRAFAQMQRAGILMEKAWNQTATFAQVRETCEDLARRFPNVHRQTKATARLFIIETYCHEGEYKQALSAAGDFEETYRDLAETSIAHYWIAKAKLQTGDATGAVQEINKVLNAGEAEKRRFPKANLNEASRRIAFLAYTALGDGASASKFSK